MFDWLVGSVIGFAAEVWRWREWEKVERIQEKYMRWVLGMDGRMPGYIVREEEKEMEDENANGEKSDGV